MSGEAYLNSAAIKVAKYLIARAGDVTGKPICNLKLQKLAYYAQGFALAIRNQPLFADTLEAWDNGPVVDIVYRQFRNGRAPIQPAPDFDAENYLPESRELLDTILATYGPISAVRLSGMTHWEPPWHEAYGLGRNTPLSLSTMKTYFSKLVEASRQGHEFEGHPVLPIDSLKHQRRRELSDRMGVHRDRLRSMLRSRPERASWPDDES